MKIAFYNPKNPSFIEKEIRVVTGGPYVHTEYVFDEFGLDSQGKTTCFSSLLNIGSIIHQVDLNDQWTLIDLPKSDYWKAFHFANGLSGRLYNSVGILDFIIPFGEHDPHAVFCSESSTLVIQYQYGGGKLFTEQKPWTVSPMKLWNLMGGVNAASKP
jgi:hypothetical protein